MPSSQQSTSLLRGLSPSRTASGLLRRNSASSEASSVGGGGGGHHHSIGTEPRHGSLTERLGRLGRRRSSHSGPHPHLRKHRSGIPTDELLLASVAADGHGGVAHLSAEEEDEAFEREWGLTLDAEARLLSEFKDSISASLPPGKTLPPHTDDYKLRRFLRARQHDVPRAREMWDKHVRWREEFGVDTDLPNFHFHERDAFVSLYPQGYHRVDRLGRPIYIQHLGSIDMRRLLEVTTEDRMLKFHVQEYERCANYILPACSLAAGRHIDQTFGVLDLKGVGLRHLTGDVKRMLTRVMSVDQDNFPEMMGHTCIINAPSVFKAIWAFVRPMLDARTQAKVEVCPAKFAPALLRWVAPENLPEYLGGQSAATLLDDSGPWQDPTLLAAVEAAEAAREGRKHKGGDRGGIAEEEEEEEEEGPGEAGATSRRRVVEVEGEESLPPVGKRGAAATAGAAAAAASISAAASSTGAEAAAPPARTAAAAAAAAGLQPLPLPPAPSAIAIQRGPSAAEAEAERPLGVVGVGVVVGGEGEGEGEGEDEDEYGTPKSECSFVSAFSEVPSLAYTAAAAATTAAESAATGGGPPASQASLLERVQRLEAALPGHAARARAQSRGAVTDASSRRLAAAADFADRTLADGRGTLLMRVGQLEAALGALVEAETFLAASRTEKRQVACCSMM